MNRINIFFRDSPQEGADVTIEAVYDSKQEVHPRRWKPVTLRRPFLFAIVIITLGLLALVQAIVIIDERNNGLLFAPRISELSTFKTFLHLYLPTTIAVFYSLVWSWIDLDVKRIEPYRQLSKSQGASGQDSLLLHYPFDFLGFVPFTALKRKHWPVFTSTCALILVAWGLTPFQGAIFATETVTKSSSQPMQLATHHLSIAEQAAQVTANYSYSASNIVWLDERLPPFMTREAAFMAFQPEKLDDQQNGETWTARTTSYSVDLTCEEGSLNRTGTLEWLQSSHGCKIRLPYGPDGTDIVDDPDAYDDIKNYTSFFAGSQNHDGLADYSIGTYCPANANNVFLVAFAENRRSAGDLPGRVTRLFCQTKYVQQTVTATIRRSDGAVLNITDISPKAPLSPTLFNTSLHEWQMNSATQQNAVRGAIPDNNWPDQDPHLSQLGLTMPIGFVKSSRVIGLAIGANLRPLEDYLDKNILATTFQAMHRLLFARAMVDVLSPDFDDAAIVNGTRLYQSQTIRVVPGFAYAVEGILGLVVIMTLILTVMNWGDLLKLQSDPDSLTALMALVSGQKPMLDQFSRHDRSNMQLLEQETCHSTYALDASLDTGAAPLMLLERSTVVSEPKRDTTTNDDPQAEYPAELSRIAGVCLVLVLAATLAAIATLYHTGLDNGLPLPSQERVVRQILENFVPTLIATLIEPVWVLLNRIMCTMQPFEGLRSGTASVKRSVGLNYSSLPPQLVVMKALIARHFVLAAVCAMALLANVLAIALSGMFNEDVAYMTRPTFATRSYEARFQTPLENITASGFNPFYSAMANFTSSTPMPAWTDNDAFYVPVAIPSGLNSSDQFRVETTSFAVDLDCHSLASSGNQSWNFTIPPRNNRVYGYDANGTVILPRESGPLVCSSEPVSIAISQNPCSPQDMALEIITPMDAQENATSEHRDQCRQLMLGIWARRSADKVCNGDVVRLTDRDATAMVCETSLVGQLVNVTVTGAGVVTQVQRTRDSSLAHASREDVSPILVEAARSLFHQKVDGIQTNKFPFQRAPWHNDSFPSDWISYIMKNLDPNSSILDPSLPSPPFESTAALLSTAYRKTFAIWLSQNHEKVLVPTETNATTVTGTILQPEVRIMVSRSMVILSTTILALYIVVASAMYLRQPAKFLPRMPITIASDIALFAASKAVREMGEAADLSRRDRNLRFDGGRAKFGYGTFVGTDGKLHVGVERAPFVVPL